MTKYVLSIEILANKGIDFTKDYFTLDSFQLSELCEMMKKDNYHYSGNLGRSISRNYYYKLQRLFNKINK